MVPAGSTKKHALIQLFKEYRKSREAFAHGYRAQLQQALNRIHPFLAVEQIPDEAEPRSQIPVLLTLRCNQRCPFCQAYYPQPEEGPPLDELKRAMDRIATTLPGSKVVLTGGEPTLRKDLMELVDHLLGLETIDLVEVQTNAVLIGAEPERFDFKPSERLRFLVAMHGLHDNVYDKCTGTRGLLPQAQEGVRRLLEAGHKVEFNYVVNTINLHHMKEYISSISTRFIKNPPPVHFSVMGIPEHRDVPELLVRYTDLLTHLESALELARSLGVVARVALSAGHSAVPLCILGGGLQEISDYPRMYEHEASNPDADPDQWWAKGPACAKCKIERYCLGLPRSYSEQFGFDELQPIG